MPAAALKLAELEPAAMVIEDGTVSSALLLESATTVAEDGALESATVHVLLAREPNPVGEHTRDVSVAGVTRLMVAVCDTPFSVAVTVAL